MKGFQEPSFDACLKLLRIMQILATDSDGVTEENEFTVQKGPSIVAQRIGVTPKQFKVGVVGS